MTYYRITFYFNAITFLFLNPLKECHNIKVTDSERKLIMRSEEDIQAGRIYTQTEVDKMVEGWLC
ncbi:hypothetical protein [Parabacteroides sp. An277]|uniref:hypothetical protein n=1 Tax=Parabacteroides sp. An277 TaxID=1965619 RepID=UPI001EF407DB|nr:hypothetical protein [Parabacteroides sp. An277]